MPTPSQTDTHTHTQSHLHLSLPTLCLTLSVRLSVLISLLWCVCVWFCWWNVCVCVAELLGESRQDLSPYSEYSKDERRGREGQKGRKRETWHFICNSLLLIFAEEYLQHEATEHDRSTDSYSFKLHCKRRWVTACASFSVTLQLQWSSSTTAPVQGLQLAEVKPNNDLTCNMAAVQLLILKVRPRSHWCWSKGDCHVSLQKGAQLTWCTASCILLLLDSDSQSANVEFVTPRWSIFGTSYTCGDTSDEHPTSSVFQFLLRDPKMLSSPPTGHGR